MGLLHDFSLEMTAKNMAGLEEARLLIPPGTRVNVTYLGNEDLSIRLSAAAAVAQWGFRPVPHIAARRLESRSHLREFLGALQTNGTVASVFLVGGDPPQPIGPYSNSAQVIETGLLEEFGVKDVSIAGHPEGHPDVAEDALWGALTAKAAALNARDMPGTIVAQYSFDADAVIAWIEQVRARGIELPIRVGLPGPVGFKRLLGFACRLGVGSSASSARRYGFSVYNLLNAGYLEGLIRELTTRLDPSVHGVVKAHFYTFNSMTATSEWIRTYQAGATHAS